MTMQRVDNLPYRPYAVYAIDFHAPGYNQPLKLPCGGARQLLDPATVIILHGPVLDLTPGQLGSSRRCEQGFLNVVV